MMKKVTIEEEKRYLTWLNRHQRGLQKYAGRWVGLLLGKGIVATDKTLKGVHHKFLRLYPHKNPHFLHVPPRGERFYILTF